ncbi:MAG: hypothetical protein JWO10_1088, partial [Microbacteriaceae bacterium]|nr:hypothetical protein [Microbacteriaceae bacterium]
GEGRLNADNYSEGMTRADTRLRRLGM